jgi:hypothetical protein
VSILSKILREKINDKQENMLVSKEYFDTLDQLQKKEYIGSQSDYQKLYRTVLVTGIRSIDIPTTVTQQNDHLSIQEWLNTIPDFQKSALFLNIQPVNINEIKLKCLTTNLTIAKKWARNARVHIARVRLHMQVSSAFIQYEDLYQHTYDIEIWNPPPPPVIEFIQNPSQSRQTPKTESNKNKRSNTQQKSNNQNKKLLHTKASPKQTTTPLQRSTPRTHIYRTQSATCKTQASSNNNCSKTFKINNKDTNRYIRPT